MTNAWTDILSTEQLDARYALTASLDPRFSAEDRKFWESRSANQLRALRAGAWTSNQSETYQVARSYLALMGEAA